MCIHPDRTVGIKLHSCPGLCSESDLSLSFELQCEMPYVVSYGYECIVDLKVLGT